MKKTPQQRGIKNRNKVDKAIVAKYIRKAGVRNLLQGTHPQQYRQTAPTPSKNLQGPLATLGPMGELGDDVIMEIDLSYAGKQTINQRLSRDLNVTNIFRELRNNVYEPLREYIEKWIDIKVPSDTTELRNSMKNAMKPSGGSRTNGFPMLVIMNTAGVDYAKVVNNMTDLMLKHPASHHRNIGRFGAPLDDKGAVKGFYDWIVLMGRNKAVKLFQDYVKNIVQPIVKPVANMLGITGSLVYNTARQLFTVKFL
jgi:hypothetical protein